NPVLDGRRVFGGLLASHVVAEYGQRRLRSIEQIFSLRHYWTLGVSSMPVALRSTAMLRVSLGTTWTAPRRLLREGERLGLAGKQLTRIGPVRRRERVVRTSRDVGKRAVGLGPLVLVAQHGPPGGRLRLGLGGVAARDDLTVGRAVGRPGSRHHGVQTARRAARV